MLTHLGRRINFWNTNYFVENMSDSLPTPFMDYLDDFKDKSVLEIGPGGGRQFMVAYSLSAFYAVADISEEVLSNPFYKKIPHFYIEDYSQRFLMTFDVVHFWYVLHHVLRKELDSFFGFVSRHLVEDGIALFNSAPLDYPKGGYKGDGISTTKFTLKEVVKALERNSLEVLSMDEINQKSTGIVFRVRKV
jgi:SAM-dependent methyltransferase